MQLITGAFVRWMTDIREACKFKHENQDSSAYCLYCKKKGGVCTFNNCPLKKENRRQKNGDKHLHSSS